MEATRDELGRLQGDVQEFRRECDRLQATNSRLRREQRRLEASLLVLREQANAQIQKAGEEAVTAVRQAAANLRHQEDQLIRKTQELTKEAAQIEAELHSHEWLAVLLALVEGKEDLQPDKVRLLALILLKPLYNWLEQHQTASPTGARWSIESLIRAFEGWHP